MLTQERLKELLSYDPCTGIFTWRVARKRGSRAGDIAGHRCPRGYIIIGLDGAHYKGHRLAHLFFHGEMPKGEIDHVNLDKSDNCIANLRDATRSQNRSNVRAHKNNACGVKGVSPLRGKWQATISSNGTQKYLGLFEKQEDAACAYALAAKELHGEFARIA